MAIFGKKKQTIDLLPEEGTSKQKINLVYVAIGAVLVILVQVFAAGFLFIANLYNSSQLDNAKKQEQEQTSLWQNYTSLASNVKTILAKDTLYNTDVKAYSGFDTKLDKIRSLIPDGVLVDQITMSNNGKTSLNAHSDQAADGYQLATIVQKNPDLTNVKLDGVTKAGSTYHFTITFSIKTD